MLKVKTSYNLNRTGFVRWRKGWALPARFSGTIDDDDSPYLVELDLAVRDQQVECTAARLVQRDGGPQVAPRLLRSVPLTAYVKALVANTALNVKETAPGTFQWTPARADDFLPIVREVDEAARKGGRRPKEQAHLEAVAKVYAEAEAARRPARQAVEKDERWGPVAPSTAARWIRAAKDAGLIDEKKGSGK